MTVYLDVFFLWNLGMNFFLLTISGQILKLHSLFWKRFFGAAIGAAGAVLCLIIGNGILLPAISYLLSLGFMAWIPFGFYSIRQTVKNLTVLFLTAFCLAGILLTVSEVKTGNSYIKQAVCLQLGAWQGTIVFRVFLVFSIMLPGAALLYFRKAAPGAELFLYQVTLRKGEYEFQGKGYLDSGNSLSQPITGLPVILMEVAEMEEFLHTTIPIEGQIPATDYLWQAIPYHSAGKEHGIFWGLKLDELVLEKNGEQWRTNQVMAAACPKLFSGSQKSLRYSVLLHRSLADSGGSRRSQANMCP